MTFVIQIRAVFLYYFLLFKHVERTWSSLFEPRHDFTNRDELAVLDVWGSKGLKTLTFYSLNIYIRKISWSNIHFSRTYSLK